MPSVEVAIRAAPLPTATQRFPFQATPLLPDVKGFAPAVQVMPSFDHAILLVPGTPPATHSNPFHATPYPVVKIVDPVAVQLIPLLEYAIVFVPFPTATQRVPFQATPLPAVEKIVVEDTAPVQIKPSYE